MLEQDHQNFLGKYFKADEHYGLSDSPLHYIKNSNNVNSDDLHDIFDEHDDPSVKVAAVSHKNASDELIHQGIHYPYSRDVNYAAVTNKNASPETLDSIFELHPEDKYLKSAAASNAGASKEQITRMLNHESPIIRAGAASNTSATKEHLQKALNDGNSRVVYAATENPNYEKYFPNGHR